MDVAAGARLRSALSATEVIVVRPPSREVELTCGGAPLVPFGAEGESGPATDLDGETLLGKRYFHEETGIELLCTRPGKGRLACDGEEMALKDAKPLPSSD